MAPLPPALSIMTDKTRATLIDYLCCHYTSLRRKLTGLLGNSDLANDALQDTWLRLQGRSDKPDNPGAYVIRTAINIAVDIQRRQSKLLSWDEINDLQTFSSPQLDVSTEYEQRHDVAQVIDRLSRLPERQQQIFLLIHWEGLSQKEAANTLGISVRTVAYELKRVHDILHTLLYGQTRSEK